jgi:hypothetical protein
VSALTDGDTAILEKLVQALRDYFELAVAPHWPVIRAQVDADCDQRRRILVDGGVYALLNSLRPMLAWSTPAFAETDGEEQGLRFHGARIVLLPAFFSLSPAVVTVPPSQPARLGLSFHPALRTGARQVAPGHRRRPGQGTGRSARADEGCRAATMAAACSTSELATRLGVTLSAVSRHTTVLRQAGLIITRRYRNTALH